MQNSVLCSLSGWMKRNGAGHRSEPRPRQLLLWGETKQVKCHETYLPFEDGFLFCFVLIECSLACCKLLIVFQSSNKVDSDSLFLNYFFLCFFLWSNKSLELPSLPFCCALCFIFFHHYNLPANSFLILQTLQSLP